VGNESYTRAWAALLLALAALSWGGNYVLARAVAWEVPPAGLSVFRWLVGLMVLLPFGWRHLQADRKLLATHWKPVVLLSLAGGAAFGILQFAALKYTTAVNGGLIGAMSPLLITAAGAILFGDRLGAGQAGGLALSIGGALVVVFQGSLARLHAFSVSLGDMLVLVNLVIWAAYTVCLRFKPPVHWLSFTIVLAAVSMLASVPLALVEHALGERLRFSPATLGAIAYTGLVSSAIAYAAWNHGVAVLGSHRAGLFLNLIPVFSIAVAWSLLGEAIELYHAVGIALIFAGIWVATAEPRPAVADRE
jgi:drug/metabolite transporter (DMT)-like permease